MPPSLLLSLILILPLSAASAPQLSHFRFSRNPLHHQHSITGPPQEYIEVTRPLPFDSLTPSCTLPLLSYTFGNTTDLPPANAAYSPPLNCTWSNAVLQFSAASNASQYDQIAAVWLAGAELLRTSTPEPTDEGIFWNIRKDVTKYSSLLRQSNLTLAVMLENVVDDVYTGIYTVNLTFLYYNITSNTTANHASSLFRPNQKSSIRKLKSKSKSKYSLVSMNLNRSLELNENPAHLILPISASGDEGFWFKIQGESDAAYQAIQIPLNTYRAVIEVYVSFHDNDEFWYSNPPNYYIETNNLTTQRGNGAYREILVKLDNTVIGSVIPFPVIFTGGINPLFWQPVVSIGAFDLPSYEIELTPFLGTLLDGEVHYFGLGVADAIPYWLLDANLHLWLDDKADKVLAEPIKYIDSDTRIQRQSNFQQLDGKFEIEGERESELSGWVNSSAGNFTTYVSTKLEFENMIEFSNNGTNKSVKQEVRVKNKVEVKSALGYLVSSIEVERKYPLQLKMSTLPAAGKDSYLMSIELDHSMEEEKKKIENFECKLENRQKSSGWVFVKDGDVLGGAGTTDQSYGVKDSFGCYSRRVLAGNGAITSDTEKFLCAAAAA